MNKNIHLISSDIFFYNIQTSSQLFLSNHFKVSGKKNNSVKIKVKTSLKLYWHFKQCLIKMIQKEKLDVLSRNELQKKRTKGSVDEVSQDRHISLS